MDRSDGDVVYVDHTDTAGLRRIHADDPHLSLGGLVEVDVVWAERSLADSLPGRRFDYVMASHVAEHVPDLLGWLGEIHDVLKPAGQLRVALPDMRFSDDLLRRETGITDLLAAWLLRARRPQMRDVLDFRLHSSSGADVFDLYHGRTDPGGLRPDLAFDVAIQSAIWARDNPEVYFDVHCWVFRATTFARLMERLASLGLLRMACAKMIDTAPPLFEFYAFLTPSDDPARAAESWREAGARLHDPLPGSAGAHAADTQAGALDRAERAEARLAALERSLSWRLTAPLRRLRRHL